MLCPMLAKAPDVSAGLVASFARHIVLTGRSVLRLWVGILVGLLGLVLGAFLWMAAVQTRPWRQGRMWSRMPGPRRSATGPGSPVPLVDWSQRCSSSGPAGDVRTANDGDRDHTLRHA